MIARIAVWEPMPDDDRQWVIEPQRPYRVLHAHHLVDQASGNGLSISFFDDTVDVGDVKAAISTKAAEIGWNDIPRPAPSSETIYTVLESG